MAASGQNAVIECPRVSVLIRLVNCCAFNLQDDGMREQINRRGKTRIVFLRTICSYECTACRYACLRRCTDRQATSDWPTLPSSTHADDVHASRPCTPQGQVNNSGQITECAFKYRQKKVGLVLNDTHQCCLSSKKVRNIYHRLRHNQCPCLLGLIHYYSVIRSLIFLNSVMYC